MSVNLMGGISQHQDDAYGRITREGFSVSFSGKFKGLTVDPVRFDIKEGLI